MRSKALLAAGLAVLVGYVPAWAEDSITERLAGMERRIQYLEGRVAAQDATIVEKDRQIAKLTESEGSRFRAVEIGGVIEIEAAHADADGEDPETTAELANVELGIAVQVNEWVEAGIVLKTDDDHVIEVDEAVVGIGPAEGPWAVTTGKYCVPFGVFGTNMISDPLTLELGETCRTALQLDAAADGLSGAVFGYNGGLDRGGDETVDGFGLALGYAMEGDGFGFDLNFAWINDLGQAGGPGDAIGEIGEDPVPGWSASATATFGDAMLIAEYLAATDAFRGDEIASDGTGAQPAAWTVEAAYGFDLGGRAATAAVGYQGTKEASGLELPETRFLAGLSVEMDDGVALSGEWARDKFDDGTKGNTVTVQLAIEF